MIPLDDIFKCKRYRNHISDISDFYSQILDYLQSTNDPSNANYFTKEHLFKLIDMYNYHPYYLKLIEVMKRRENEPYAFKAQDAEDYKLG